MQLYQRPEKPHIFVFDPVVKFQAVPDHDKVRLQISYHKLINLV